MISTKLDECTDRTYWMGGKRPENSPLEEKGWKSGITITVSLKLKKEHTKKKFYYLPSKIHVKF